MKKLVVYYSLGGNTRAVAKRIAQSLRADLMEIRTIKTYPDDYDVLLSLGEKEVKSGYMPQIAPLTFDANTYDTVIIGTPVWWYTYAPAVKKYTYFHARFTRPCPLCPRGAGSRSLR